MLTAIIDDIKSCDDVVLATCGGMYPDARHLTNALNRNITGLDLYFMTGRNTPKYTQIKDNPKCMLYYFNSQTRHAVRLYGEMRFVDDLATKRKYWDDEYEKFGYHGPDDNNFILMKFVAQEYKIYIGNELIHGKI